MLFAWVVFPLVLVALSLGCGLLLEACVGRRLPSLLLAPAGFAAIVVIAGILTARGETASMATPAVVLAALAGAILRRPWRDRTVERWTLAAGLAVFAVYAAPVVLSGKPTFAGYITLDDTATWMAFVDQVMDHGRDLSRLELSTHARTLEVNLPAGYPVGALLPLGVGAKLTGADVAWLVQPYMATMAAIMALALGWLAQPLFGCRRLPALVAFGAAQAALLYGYALWGGVKEIAVALLLATIAATGAALGRSEAGWRDTVPIVVATTALLGAVGWGGMAWLAPLLGLLALGIWRLRGLRAAVGLALPFLLLTTLLAVPPMFAAGAFSPTQEGLTDAGELGNLIEPLGLAQIVGIWPSGDFRVAPGNGALTAYLVGLAVVAALAGAVVCWRRRAWQPGLYVASVLFGSIAVFAYASPWVGAKALASGGSAVLFLALAGAAAVAARVERAVGATVLALILAGVLWSNALAYHDVSLAPYEQLRELEEIGEEFAGEGPALITEYQPYGARHFLRELDAEGASELRVRPVTLVDGTTLEKGEWADTDRIALDALLTYRTLVLRRSPAQSRPPSAYSLVERGDYYNVWQREPGAAAEIAEHLPLGDENDPGAVPACAEVRRLAAVAGPGGTVVAARRGANVAAPLVDAERPAEWVATEAERPEVLPGAPGSARLRFEPPRAGLYDLFVLGGTRNRLSLTVDGAETGSVSAQRNEDGQYLGLGRVELRAGPHVARLTYADASMAPGSGGPAYPIGPLALSPVNAVDPPLLRVAPAAAGRLCGQRLDWLEALGPAS